MTQIIKPLRPGQSRVDAESHPSGGIVLKINREGVLLSPRQAHDLAVGILAGLGLRMESTEFANSLPHDTQSGAVQ